MSLEIEFEGVKFKNPFWVGPDQEVSPLWLKTVSSIYKNPVVTGTVINGYNQIKGWLEDLENSMKNNYASLNKIHSSLVENIREYSFLETMIKERDTIDDEMKKIREA